MSPAIVGRLSSSATRAAACRAGSFSTSARSLRPTNGDLTAPSAPKSWRCSNLAPQTRKYVIYGVAACVAVDCALVYNYYPQILGMGEGNKE